MRLIDEQHTLGKVPFGVIKMSHYLSNLLSLPINPKRVRRLMQTMGIQGLYPKKKTTLPNKEHKIYPYLLKNYEIKRPNEVWSADITYIPMRKGFMYLVAIIDWYSRFIISWELSNTLESSFCIESLEKALKLGTPIIFNTDQGVQFTSNDFITILLNSNIMISMDGKGRYLDNIFIERYWRTLKQEEIYRNAYESVPELYDRLQKYFYYYNNERPHQSLDYKTPYEVHNILDKKVNLF